MSNPSYNKWKATTIYGKLAVRDLTNSTGTSVIENGETDLSGNFLCRGDATFTNSITCNANVADINANNKLTTKEYVDSVNGASILGLNNTWSGTNSYNTYLPTSNLGAGSIVSQEVFLTKGLMDNIYGRKAGVNNWTNENSFDSYLPTSILTPTSSSQLTTKTYVDSVSGVSILGLNNTFSGINTFTNNILFNSNITSPYFVNKSTTESDQYTTTLSLTSQGNNLYTNNSTYSFTQNSAQQTYTSAVNVNQQVLQSITNFTAGTYIPNTITINTPISIKTQGTINVGTSISFTVTHTITSISAQVFSNETLQNTITGTINSSNLSTRTITCSFSAGGNKPVNIEQYFYNYSFDINLNSYPTGTLMIKVCPTISTTMTISSYSGNYNFQLTPSYNINTTTSTITDTGTTANRTISYSTNSNGTGYTALSISSASSTATYNRGLTQGTTYVNKIYTNGINQNTGTTTTNTLDNLTTNSLTTNSLTCNSSFNLLPAGMVIQYTGTSAPTGWLLCQGATLNAVANPIYQPLYNVIGIQFGGTNNTDFKLPDYRGAFLRGFGTQPSTNYASSGTLNTTQSHANQNHTHNANHGHSYSHMFKVTGLNQGGVGFDVIHCFPTGRPFTATGLSVSGNNFDTAGQVAGSTDNNETRPFNYSVNYLIKY